MKRIAWAVAALPLFGLVVGCGGSDKDKLQGTWVMESVELGGKAMPLDDKDKESVMVFAGDKVTNKKGGKDEEATFTLDPSKNPKTIDIKPTKGGESEKPVSGIYTFEGEKLKIAFSPGERPKDFSSKEAIVMTLARKK